MQQPSTQSAVLDAWHMVCRYIAAGNAHEFLGRKKETLVFHRIRREIEASDLSRLLSLTGPDMQARFRNWNIDLVCVRTGERLAIEGKYKLQRDGAVPDNRKAAFFDLFKLEQYVLSGEYSVGLFLWLTDEQRYLQQATGDSADFSTHEGRTYEAGTQLMAERTRNPTMPLPLVLTGRYVFKWQRVLPDAHWYSLILHVTHAG